MTQLRNGWIRGLLPIFRRSDVWKEPYRVRLLPLLVHQLETGAKSRVCQGPGQAGEPAKVSIICSPNKMLYLYIVSSSSFHVKRAPKKST